MNMFYNNRNTIRIILFLIFLFGKSGMGLFAQSSITGKVTDGEWAGELIGATISVFENGELVIKETADIDGNYNVQLVGGIYDIEVTYVGYPSEKIEGIILIKNQILKIDFQLKGDFQLSEPGLFEHKIPELKKDTSTILKIKTEYKISYLPTRSIPEIASFTAGVTICQ